jgi:D-threo-aldose 1-dehydrogenase
VLAAAVFNSGVLAQARPPDDARFDYAPASREILERARRIAAVCDAHGVTLPQAAIAFPLTHPVVAGVVLGMRSPDEVHGNLAAHAADVPSGLWSDLRAEGLLDERAPLPA